LRGGLAKDQIEASPERPALFIERRSRIAKLLISQDLELRLTDDAGLPVDLSVAHVDVWDPAGRLSRHYSANVTVRAGHAAYRIPFALNDTRGIWRVQARDVISGLTAEVTLKR
jgi:hypothetical protein